MNFAIKNKTHRRYADTATQILLKEQEQMNITQEQIELEFIRQVRLCSGLGREKMEHILWQFWETRKPGTTQPSYIDSIPAQNGNARKTSRRK